MKNSILTLAVIVAILLAAIAIVISSNRPAQAKGTNDVQPTKTYQPTSAVQLFTQTSPSQTKVRPQKLDPQPYVQGGRYAQRSFSQSSTQSSPQASKLNYSQTSKLKTGGKTKSAYWN